MLTVRCSGRLVGGGVSARGGGVMPRGTVSSQGGVCRGGGGSAVSCRQICDNMTHLPLQSGVLRDREKSTQIVQVIITVRK